MAGDPDAVNPLFTILGFAFANLLSWPGLGKLLLEAVQSFDINVVMTGLLLGAVNLLAHLLLDPQIRPESLL